MIRRRRGRSTRLLLTEELNIWTVEPGKLALYDAANNDAWIAAENPANLRKWA